MNKGTIIQMQDYSIHDGDGVRTTVFLAGCPLRCQWCANPESWMPDSRLRYETDVDTIMGRLERDSLFFRFSGGGVTFSGGEPFFQLQFLQSLAESCFDSGISMWAESCGYFSFQQARDILVKLDHIFIDLKHMDSSIHRQYTGVGNELILENSKRISQLGIPLTFRIPAISGLNLTENNILAAAEFISHNIPQAAVELLPYHELGKEKYTALGKEQEFHSFVTPTEAELNAAYFIFESFDIKTVK